MTKIEQVIEQLIILGIIPRIGQFDIKEEILNFYVRLYSKNNSVGNSEFDLTLARRLAGLNLLYYKLKQKDLDHNSCKEGLVYLIENPAWPNHYKIGMSIDINKRLAQFQTADPYRRFKIKTYEFTLNRRLIEKKVHTNFNANLVDGEWVSNIDAQKIIDYIVSLHSWDLTGIEQSKEATGRNAKCRVINVNPENSS